MGSTIVVMIKVYLQKSLFFKAKQYKYHCLNIAENEVTFTGWPIKLKYQILSKKNIILIQIISKGNK